MTNSVAMPRIRAHLVLQKAVMYVLHTTYDAKDLKAVD